MALFDSFGDNSGGLYGDIFTDDQKAALGQRGLLGFLGGMANSGALDYTMPFVSGKMPAGFAKGLAGGMAGMGEAQDAAATNAIKVALGSKEITGKDIENQLARLNLEGWLRAQGIVGTNSAAPTLTAAPSAAPFGANSDPNAGMAVQPSQPRTQTADTSGAAGEYGVGQSGWPIPMLRTNDEFPALPPNSTNATSSGPGWAEGSSPITPASYNPARLPLGPVPGLLAGNGAAPPVQLAQAAPAVSGGLLSPSPGRRPVPPLPMQTQAGVAGAQPLISPQQLINTYNQMRSFPAGAASANQALQMLQRMVPEGFQIMSDGSARLMPGMAEGKGALAASEEAGKRGAGYPYDAAIETHKSDLALRNERSKFTDVPGVGLVDLSRLNAILRGGAQGQPGIGGNLANNQPGVVVGRMTDAQRLNLESTLGTSKERLKEYHDEGRSAVQQVSDAAAITDLLDRVKMGWGANTIQEGARILSAFGVPENRLKQFAGTDPNAGDTLNKLFLKFSADAVRQMGAREPGSVISLFSRAFPNLETQPRAAELMTNALRLQAQWKQDRANAAEQWDNGQRRGMGQFGENYAGFSGFEQQFAGSNNPRDYWRASAAMSNEREVAWQNTSATERQRIYDRIPAGSTYYDAEGNQRRKPGA